jgi:hypothetical protein
MKRLNALDWADGFSFVAFGVRVGLRVTDPGLLPDLAERLPPGWGFSTTPRVHWMYSVASVPSRKKRGNLIHQLYTGKYFLTRGSDFSRIQTAFGTDLQVELALRSPRRMFIHAGVVGWKGRAILVPGEAGSGKSTLIRALVQAGATFYSDEFAVLDGKGRVHPYPLPLRIKKKHGPGSISLPVQELGGSVGTEPLPVGLVLSTRYDPNGPGRMVRLTPGKAALELIANAVQAQTRPARVMEATGKAVKEAKRLKGRRGEADDMVDTLLTLW